MNLPKLDPTISMGHIIQLGVLLVGVGVGWANLQGTIALVRSDMEGRTGANSLRIESNERRIAVTEKAAELVPERLARIEAILERIERAQSEQSR